MVDIMNMMNVVIEGNNIFSVDIYGSRECIGVTSQSYLEMKKTAELATEKAESFFEEKEKYFKKLVDNGLEVKPKTQEDINAELIKKLSEQEETNRKLMEAIVNINAKLEGGKNNASEQLIGNGGKIGNGPQKSKPSNGNG